MKTQNLSRAAIVRNGGPSRPTLYRIENDPTYSPESFTLDRLADALGVNRIWLRTGEGEMLPPIDIKPWEAQVQSELKAPKVPPRPRIQISGMGPTGDPLKEVETPVGQATASAPGLDRELFALVLQAALEEGRDRTIEEIVTITIGTYEFIQQTGRVNRIREVVKMGFS